MTRHLLRLGSLTTVSTLLPLSVKAQLHTPHLARLQQLQELTIGHNSDQLFACSVQDQLLPHSEPGQVLLLTPRLITEPLPICPDHAKVYSDQWLLRHVSERQCCHLKRGVKQSHEDKYKCQNINLYL
jgi:hypothetical protein